MTTKLLRFWVAGLWLVCLAWGGALPAEARSVVVVELDGDTINPITADFIIKSLHKAEERNAEAFILQLDTPGGLLASTRMIVKKILNARVPVVVYVAPEGARAGSAGVFITYAAHMAAMAPSTHIGAAHPVNFGPGAPPQKKFKKNNPKDKPSTAADDKEDAETQSKSEAADSPEENGSAQEKSARDDRKSDEETNRDDGIADAADPLSEKILNDTVAFIKALAQKRGRNEEWAEKSVSESDSITAEEAVSMGVVDFLARDRQELLKKIDGREVALAEGSRILHTSDAVEERLTMDVRQQLFNILADPNIAYFLLILGFYGLLYEVTHPGFGVPGFLGTLFLILALMSMQTLPTNYAGLALMALGVLLFIVEAMAPGLGLASLGGVVAMTLGGLLLFDSPDPVMRVSWPVIAGSAVATGGISVFLVRLALKAHRRKKQTGVDGLVGERGRVHKPLGPDKEGKVFVHGEIWNAVSDVSLKKGDRIRVVSVDRMTLKVEPDVQ